MYKHIWRCRWHYLDLELVLVCLYKELHVYGQMNVCHAQKVATSPCTLMCDDGARVPERGVNQIAKNVGANWFCHTLISSMIIVNPFHTIASSCKLRLFSHRVSSWAANRLACRAHNSSQLMTAV